MKKIIIVITVLLLSGNICIAQYDTPFVKKSFVIIQSTKDYKVAKATAKMAAAKLHQPLDLRGLKPDKTTGLTFADSICAGEGGSPCYIARGRYDDGDFVSIEWSNAINGFAKGYYVVITGAGSKEETAVLLKRAKPFFKDAYVKQAEVYIGCMH
jgi:hypothetical protein